jgi:ASC-1-like (ASCH) protein
MKKIHPDFPIYVIENFHTVTAEELPKIVETIVYNQMKHRMQGAASFWLMEDDQQRTFGNLLYKFENTLRQIIPFTKTPDSIPLCNVYYSTKTRFVEVYDSHGELFYHNHKHTEGYLKNHTTLAGVYYMNVPDKDSGAIEFKIDTVTLEDGTTYTVGLEPQYNQLNKAPYKKIEGVRTTVRKEISYQPKNGDLVIFPAYLDHRPRRTEIEGHRIAVNFELMTQESAIELVQKIEDYIKSKTN